MEKYGFIYAWFDKKNYKLWKRGIKNKPFIYIGCHWGTKDDGYICSSDRMRHVYKRRPKTFRARKILKTNIPQESLLIEEYKFLKLMKKEELGVKYYNLANNLFPNTIGNEFRKGKTQVAWNKGKSTHIWITDGVNNKRLSVDEKIPKNFHRGRTQKSLGMTGKIHTDKTKLKISDSKKGKCGGENHPMYGKSHTEEAKEKNRLKHIGNKASFETKEKISNGNIGKHNGKRNDETKEKMRQSKLGRSWFTNGIESKLLKTENAPVGWKNGRAFYINKDDINNNQAMI